MKTKHYIKSIFEIIQFLVINHLSFRGNFNEDLQDEDGLFKNLFEFTINKDSKLRSITQSLPENSK